VASSITTTTSFTSVPTTVTATGTSTGTIGSAIRPVFASDQTPYDVLGLIAALTLLAPMVLRRLMF
jgi:hypothetical protein